MSEILTGTTFLIFMVMLLRSLTRGRISMRFRYGLWLIVMLRLVVPVSFGSSPFSVLNLAWSWPDEMVRGAETTAPAEGTAYGQPDSQVTGNGPRLEREGDSMAGDRGMSVTAEEVQQDMRKQAVKAQTFGNGISEENAAKADNSDTADSGRNRQLRLLLRFIWIAGMLVTGGYMLAGQLRFSSYLHRMRAEIPAEELPEFWYGRLCTRRMRVYQVTGLPSPCLVGRSIYIEPRLLQEKDRLSHVLSHEYAHAVQGDALWSFMRSVLCAVYWFYPLVWIAACEAKRDSELACDERAIVLLGESQRFAYGRTLLDLLSAGAGRTGYAGAVLSMGGSEKNIKERISMIAGNKKKSRAAAVLVILAAMITCSCAFTGAAAAGTGKTVLLTNEGSLGNSTAAAESTEAAKEQEQDQPEEAPDVGPGPEEEAALQRQREEYRRDKEDVESFGAEHAAFQPVLDRMEDTDLASAEPMEYAAYYDYVYEGAECPLEDGKWYWLPQKDETGIDFYGLYTKDYGCRGLKIKVGDDVNTFDQPWVPVAFPIDTLILEEAETDGMPRSFAFELCVVNNGNTERWQLYVADRYDTGTIDLYPFREEDCRDQLKDQKIILRVDRESAEVDLVCEGDTVAGTVDISQYREDTVEEALWDNGLTGYLLEDGRITFITGIGLKVADSDELRYHGLSLIGFPVETGSFGDRKFILGKPYVDENHASVRLNR